MTDFNSNTLSVATNSIFGITQGESRFVDVFQVTGGAGTGTVTFNWSVVGTMTQGTPPVNCDLSRDGDDYFLGALSAGSATGLASQTLPLCTAGTTNINRSGSFSVVFTYGVPFAEGLSLSGSALNGQAGWSAKFTSIVLPPGATLTADSATVYPTTSPSATSLLVTLSNQMQALNLQPGIFNSLDQKLQTALAALNAGNGSAMNSACNRIDAFEAEVAAQAGSHLTPQQAAQLTTSAQFVRVALGCQ